MTKAILIEEVPEQFYQKLQHLIKDAIREELSEGGKKPEDIEYLKKPEVCKMLKVSKPTIDRHVEKGFYRKYHIGSRVFYNKKEILEYLAKNSNTKFDFSI